MKELTNLPSIDKTHLKGVGFFEQHPIIPPISIAKALDLMVLKKDKPVIDCLDLEVTGDQVREDSLLLAKTMLQLGIKPGDIITCQMPNLYQAFLVFHAANTIGATVSYLSAFASKENVRDYLIQYNSKLLINIKPKDLRNDYYIDHSPAQNIISLDENNVNSRNFRMESSIEPGKPRQFNYNEIGKIADLYHGPIKSWFGPQQEALILHTSGSTGKPKSMIYTNENIMATLIYYKNSTHTPKPKPGDTRWMNVVPFMYPYGFVASVLAPLLCGREVIFTPNVTINGINDCYSKKPNIIFGSPAFIELSKKGMSPDLDCSSLHTFVSGGDFLSIQKSHEAMDFFKKHGANVMMANGSGNGEILGCCTNSMGVEYKPETVGQLVVGPEYRIIDPETHEEVHYDEPGVLCVKGKHVFKGYFGNQKLTDEAMITIDGEKYYNTGNYGILHTNRYFELIGRASRFYIISTLNKVYCEGVQKRISLMDMVDACIVVPKPNDETLYEGKAYIKLKEGFVPSEEMTDMILSECYLPHTDPETGEVTSLKEYEIPESVTYITDIKRNVNSDKVAYEYYKDLAEKEYEAEKQVKKSENDVKKLLK